MSSQPTPEDARTGEAATAALRDLHRALFPTPADPPPDDNQQPTPETVEALKRGNHVPREGYGAAVASDDERAAARALFS